MVYRKEPFVDKHIVGYYMDWPWYMQALSEPSGRNVLSASCTRKGQKSLFADRILVSGFVFYGTSWLLFSSLGGYGKVIAFLGRILSVSLFLDYVYDKYRFESYDKLCQKKTWPMAVDCILYCGIYKFVLTLQGISWQQ